MAFVYSVTERKNMIPNAKMPVVAYANSRMMGVVSLDRLALSISRRSTVHRADVSAVLTVLPEVVMEYLSLGLAVRLGELGSFALRFRSKAAASKKEFTSDNVTKVHIRYTPGVRMLEEMAQVPVRSVESVLSGNKEKAEKPEEPGTPSAPDTPDRPATGGDHSGESGNSGENV